MRAFSLVEVLVSSVIVSILISALFLVLSVGQHSWISGDAHIQIRQEISRALMVMGKELKATRPSKINITMGSSANFITFNIPQDPNHTGEVLDASGNIIWSPGIAYSLNISNQIVRVSDGNTSVIANNISSLQFTRPQDRIIQIDVTASKTSSAGKPVQDSDQMMIKLRN